VTTTLPSGSAADAPSAPPERARLFRLADVRAEAEAMLRDARAEADALIARARAEAVEAARRAAREGRAVGEERGERAGRLAGEAAGRAEALAELRRRTQDLDSAWADALDDFARTRAGWIEALEHDAVDLAVSLARAVVGEAVECDRGLVIAQVDKALRLVAEERDLVVRVHPDDREIVAEALPRLASRLLEGGEVRLVDDDAIARGGCRVIVEGGVSAVDATLDGQIAHLARQFRIGEDAGRQTSRPPTPPPPPPRRLRPGPPPRLADGRAPVSPRPARSSSAPGRSR